MPQETEIKLHLSNPKAFLTRLKRLKATKSIPRLHEFNLLFDTPEGGLAKHGQLLRIRTESSPGKNSKANRRDLLTFKSPVESLAQGARLVQPTLQGRYKIREETELPIADAPALQKIFEGLGLRGWFRYEKFRTTYKLPNRYPWAKALLIEIDETAIGTYAELEGPRQAIDQAAKLLGFTPAQYIQKSYLALYLEDCQRRNQSPTDMLFKPKPSRTGL